MNTIVETENGNKQMIDSFSVGVHQHAAGSMKIPCFLLRRIRKESAGGR